MNEKFTPGPWKTFDHDGYGVNVWNVAGNKCIAERCRSDDARLIAAAPDMYEALKAFIKEYGTRWGEHDELCPPYAQSDTIRLVLAALAKAEATP